VADPTLPEIPENVTERSPVLQRRHIDQSPGDEARRMSDEQQSTSEPSPVEEGVSLAQFLESVSPGQTRKITTSIAVRSTSQGRATEFRLILPEIQLHCSSDACNGERLFRTEDESYIVRGRGWNFDYVNYWCGNCQKQTRIYALAVVVETDAEQKKPIGVRCYKFGELLPYDPPTPSRLISLLGTGRDLFLKGRRCEIQGLGIGAFAYYRRVVEDQKNRILAEIIKAAQTISAPPETIAALQGAQKEHQVSQGYR
jgi:hypothetical protein